MSRARKGFLLGTIVVALLAFALHQALQLDRYRPLIARQVAAITGGTVTAEHLAWGLNQGLWLRIEGLRIDGATLPPADIAVEVAYGRLALGPLLDSRLVIEELRFEGPVITYHLRPPLPEDASKDDAEGDASAGLPLQIELARLDIDDGVLTLADSLSVPGRTVKTRLTAITLALRELRPDHTATLQASAVPGDSGHLRIDGQLAGLRPGWRLEHPKLALELALDTVPLAGLSPYLSAAGGERTLGGALSATLSYEGDLEEQGLGSAWLDLGQVRYSDPGLSLTPLPGAPLTLDLALALDGPDLAIESLALRTGPSELVASGRIGAWREEARLHEGAVQGLIAFNALDPLIPWEALGEAAAPLRELTTGVGEIRLEHARFPEIAFSGTRDWQSWLEGIDARLTFAGLAATVSSALPRIDALSGSLALSEGRLQGGDIQARLGPLSTPTLHFTLAPLTAQGLVKARLKGPLRLRRSADPALHALLRRGRLAGMIADAEVDLEAELALSDPTRWRGEGHVQVEDLAMRFLGGDWVTARGAVHLRQRQSLDLLLSTVEGRLNAAPFAVDGALYDLDTPERLADLRASVAGLKLGRLEQLFPQLAPYALKGTLSGELDVYFQQNAPQRTRAKGTLQTRGLNLDIPQLAMTLRSVHGDLALASNRIEVKRLGGRINEQHLALSGHLQDFQDPQLELRLSSPLLNVNRLLPPPAPAEASAAASVQETAAAEPPPLTLPDWARRGSARIAVDIASGVLDGVPFSGLRARGSYRRTRLEALTVDMGLPQGTLWADLSADLGDLQAIPFRLRHRVRGADIRTLSKLLKDEVERASGPLHSDGDISGNTANLIHSLSGHLSARAGPGRIPDRSAIARTLFNILSIVNIQGIIKGDLGGGLAIDGGMPYDGLLVETTLAPGRATLDRIDLLTPAFSARAVGDVDLLGSTLDLNAVITVLGTVDRLLGFVPLIGQSVADLTKIYLRIDGTFEKPSVRVQPAKGLRKSISGILDLPMQAVDGTREAL